jgi:rhomboid protease GluP
VFKRQRTGSVVCASCGVLVGVGDATCYNCGRRNPALWGFAPLLRSVGTDLGFVPFVIGACFVVYALVVVAMVGANSMEILPQVLIFGPSARALEVFGASGANPVFGRYAWWTLLSAGWLHAGIFHLGMNMLSLRNLAPSVADIFGPGRMVIIYTAGAVVGFLASSLAGEYLPPWRFIGGGVVTVGASASIAGLIGAILAYGHRSGSGMARSYANQGIVMLLVIGLIFPAVDNWAHFGGFAGGYLAAKALDPLKPERIDHLLIALACLAASMLSIAWSFLSYALAVINSR